jgi:hypothetical protein
MIRYTIIVIFLVLLPVVGIAQQEMRGAHKGATDPGPVTSTELDANRQALDVCIKVTGEDTSECFSPTGGGGGTSQAPILASGSIGGLDETVSIDDLEGTSVTALHVSGGGWLGTISFEATINGTNWSAIFGTPPATGAVASTTSGGTTGFWQFNTGGYLGFRARYSTYTSGSATITLIAVPGASTAYTIANVAQLAGTTVATGNGGVSAGVQRVSIASDSSGNLATIGTSVTPGTSGAHLGKAEDTAHATGHTGVLTLCKRTDTAASSADTDGDYATCNQDASGRSWVNPGTLGVEDAAETAGGNLNMAGTVRRDTAASSAGSSGDNATLNTDANGLAWTRTMDPCSALAKTYIAVNISSATTTELTSSLAGASTHYYVCSLNLVTAAANNVALVDDDTDNCASVTSGLAGGTTAGSGWNFAANGGLTFGNGQASVFRTNGTNRVLCLVTSAATQLSGSLTVVAAP